MLVYSKTAWGIHLISQAWGSAVTRTYIFGAVALLQTLLIYLLVNDPSTVFLTADGVPSWGILTTLVGFIVIFRQNVSFSRYHEGRTRLQAMTAAWTAAACKALSFDGGGAAGARAHPPAAAAEAPAAPVPNGGNGRKASTPAGREEMAAGASALRFRLEIVHLFSLLHALALQFLRSDWDLANLQEHEHGQLPPWEARAAGFRPSWMDWVMLHGTFERKVAANRALPLPVVGLPSAAEVVLLTPSGPQQPAAADVRLRLAPPAAAAAPPPEQRARRPPSRRSRLWEPSTGLYQPGAAERVYQAFYWTQERLRVRVAEGGLALPAPILASLWSSLDAGLEAFEQCRYLCDTPFPAPWAQLVVVLLLCHQFLLPFLVVAAIKSVALGAVFAVVTVQGPWALNEVARELEDPFIFEPQALPLARYSYQFNERLLAVVNTALPSSPDVDVMAAVAAAAEQGSTAAPDMFRAV